MPISRWGILQSHQPRYGIWIDRDMLLTAILYLLMPEADVDWRAHGMLAPCCTLLWEGSKACPAAVQAAD